VHDASTRGLGGWTLSGHHAYDGKNLYRGNSGKTRGTEAGRLDSVHRSADLGGDNFQISRNSFHFEVTRSGGVFLRQAVSAGYFMRFIAPSGAISPVGDQIGQFGTFALEPTSERLFVADSANR